MDLLLLPFVCICSCWFFHSFSFLLCFVDFLLLFFLSFSSMSTLSFFGVLFGVFFVGLGDFFGDLPLPFPFAFAFAFALACAKATPAGLFKFVFLPSCSPVSASSFSGVASCSLSSSGVSASFSAFFAASASFTPCASFAFLAAMASKYLDLGEPGRHRAAVLFGVTSPSLIKRKETA